MPQRFAVVVVSMRRARVQVEAIERSGIPQAQPTERSWGHTGDDLRQKRVTRTATTTPERPEMRDRSRTVSIPSSTPAHGSCKTIYMNKGCTGNWAQRSGHTFVNSGISTAPLVARSLTFSVSEAVGCRTLKMSPPNKTTTTTHTTTTTPTATTTTITIKRFSQHGIVRVA